MLINYFGRPPGVSVMLINSKNKTKVGVIVFAQTVFKVYVFLMGRDTSAPYAASARRRIP